MTKPATLIEPRNSLDLLTNLKAAIETDYLQDADFYETGALKSFFGCTEVESGSVSREATTAFRYQFTGTEQIIPPSRHGDGAQMTLNRIVRSEGKVEPELHLCPTVFVDLSIHFLSANTETPFEKVTEIFGGNWSPHREKYESSRRVLAKPTHDHGNETILYNLGNETASKLLKLEFDENGCLLLVGLEIR